MGCGKSALLSYWTDFMKHKATRTHDVLMYPVGSTAISDNHIKLVRLICLELTKMYSRVSLNGKSKRQSSILETALPPLPESDDDIIAYFPRLLALISNKVLSFTCRVCVIVIDGIDQLQVRHLVDRLITIRSRVAPRLWSGFLQECRLTSGWLSHVVINRRHQRF